ncbi:hypothetical protein PAXRUDRAFT_108449, partial [Paxillus rubicundulus Ve08.2h10]
MRSRSFMKLSLTFTCRNTSLLVWLHTKHVPLNEHLHHIKKSDSLDCPHCPGSKEDVAHFILKCPHYVCKHFVLNRSLRWQTYYLPHLLSNSKVILFLINYVNSMGQFKATFNEVPNAQEQ